MATELAKAYVQIIPSTEGIAGNLTNLLSSEAEIAGKNAGVSFSGSFSSAMEGVAAIASSVIDVVGSAVSSLANDISEVANAGDTIDKQSQKLGLSAKAYQEWDFVLQHAGTSINNMGTGLKTLTNKLDDAKNGSEDAQNMFAQLGLSLDDISNMSREEIFGAAITGFQEMADSTERAALANDLFGKSGQELTPLFNTSVEETAALIESVNNLGGVMSDTAVKDSAAFADSMLDVTTAFDGLKRNALSDLLPYINDIMEGLALIVSGDSSGFGMLKTGIDEFVGNVSSKLPELVSGFSTIVMDIGNAVIDNAPLLLESAGEIIIQLATGIVNQLPSILRTGVTILVTLIKSITDNLPMLIKTATQIIVDLAKELTNPATLVSIIKSGIELILALIDGVLEALPELLEAMPVIVDNVVSALLQCLPLLIDAGFRLFTALLENLPQIIELSITATLDIVDSIINQLIASAPDIAAQGFDSFMAFLDKIPEFLIELKSSVKEIVTKLVEFFTDNFDKIKEVGKNLVDKIWEGIKDAWAQLKTDASGLMNGLVDDLKGIWNGGDVIGGISNQINSVVSEATPTTATVGVMGTYSSGTLAQDNTSNDLYNLLSENLPIIASGRNNTIVLEGDADGVFNIVRTKNNMYMDTTKYNPLVSG